MCRVSQNQQAELSSLSVRASFVSDMSMLFTGSTDSSLSKKLLQLHLLLQTGSICLWMIKLRTRCCGFPTVGLRCVAELRRSAPSWIDQRDTSILHRYVRKYRYSREKKNKDTFTGYLVYKQRFYLVSFSCSFFIFSLGGVQRGGLEHEGLLGGGILRVGGNWSHL